MLNILHLSDLHFGQMAPGKSAHRFADASGKPLPNELATILLSEIAEPPHAVITSGDVGWSGKSEDYAYAIQFFKRLRQSWDSVPFVFAAGNHDVDYGLDASEQQISFLTFLREVQGPAFDQQYVLDDIVADRRMIVAFQQVDGSEGERALVIAVNSAAYLKDKDAAGKPVGTPVGFSADELRAIDIQLARRGMNEIPLRLFVLHHALFPFAEPPWSRTIDPSTILETPDMTIVATSATLQNWLSERSFQIVLHGHKHTMHGRHDTLWRRADPTPLGRKLFVIGAGSTGVEQGHLAHTDPLSYNMLEITRLSRTRWWVDVSVFDVLDPPQKPRKTQTFGDEVGEPIDGAPFVFHAENIDDCHRSIQRKCEGKGILRNFVSVVEDCTFKFPPTAKFHRAPATMEQVESTFQALHPEYISTKEWKDLRGVDAVLRDVSPRLQFEHGPRLFGKARTTGQSPMDRVRGELGGNAKDLGADAYASLFNPEVDTASEKRNNPTPHLMSVHFIPEKGFLDVVVTFRKIELSYWWVANTYEIGRLLEWTARYGSKEKRTARRITFFAALAHWKGEPEAAMVTRLDRMSLRDLTMLVARVHNNETIARDELLTLLREKLEYTNDKNLDGQGLSECLDLFSGLTAARTGTPALTSFVGKLSEAVTYIRNAINSGNSAAEADDARTALAQAIGFLSGL